MRDRLTKIIGNVENTLDVRRVACQRGVTLVELLITVAIFSVLMTGIFNAYFSQLEHSTREYEVAESEIELSISKRILEQDLQMTGYGLADDYPSGIDPMPIVFTNDGGTNSSDKMILKGTALGQLDRVSQGWSYIDEPDAAYPTKPNLRGWGDPREKIEPDDRIVLIEPSSKTLLTDAGGKWLFKYIEASGVPDIVNLAGTSFSTNEGTLVYGLYSSSKSANDTITTVRPYYSVHYYLGATDDSLDSCAPGTSSLLRAESVVDETPTGGDPLLACVLNFQVALGLDTDTDGMIDNWDADNSIVGATSFIRDNMNDQLKRIKVYLLVQDGNRDPNYTYPLNSIRVGEGTTIGRDVTLTADQKKYRWRLVSLSIQPRNVR